MVLCLSCIALPRPSILSSIWQYVLGELGLAVHWKLPKWLQYRSWSVLRLLWYYTHSTNFPSHFTCIFFMHGLDCHCHYIYSLPRLFARGQGVAMHQGANILQLNTSSSTATRYAPDSLRVAALTCQFCFFTSTGSDAPTSTYLLFCCVFSVKILPDMPTMYCLVTISCFSTAQHLCCA